GAQVVVAVVGDGHVEDQVGNDPVGDPVFAGVDVVQEIEHAGIGVAIELLGVLQFIVGGDRDLDQDRRIGERIVAVARLLRCRVVGIVLVGGAAGQQARQRDAAKYSNFHSCPLGSVNDLLSRKLARARAGKST